MLPPSEPDRIHVAFDDHRLVTNAGLLLPVTLAQHLGLGELVDNNVDPGEAPGRANVGDQMLTLVASALIGGDCIDDADALRTGGTARAIGGVVKAPSTLGTFLRSFRWGHVRQLDRVSRELLARAWGGSGRRTVDHRPGLHHLRDLRTGQGGCPPSRLHRPVGLSPAAGRCRRNRRCADVSAVGGPGQHGSGRGPLPAGDGGSGALCRGHRTTHGAGRPRLLHPRSGLRLPPDGCPLLHHHPPARPPAEPHRGHTRKGVDAHTLLDGRRRRRGRNYLHTLSLCARCAGAAHRAQSEAHARFPTGPLRPPTATTPSSPTGTGTPRHWRRTIAATPRSKMPSATSSTAWASTVSPRAASPPTPPGGPYRSSPTTLYGT